MTLSDAEFAGFCRAYRLLETLDDPRFSIEARMAHRAEWTELLTTQVADAAKRLSLDEAEARFRAEGVPFSRVQSLDDLPADPQLVANGLLRESEHPVAGRLREPRPAPRFGATVLEPSGPAPTVGQHTAEILSELGYDASQQEALRRERVVSEEKP